MHHYSHIDLDRCFGVFSKKCIIFWYSIITLLQLILDYKLFLPFLWRDISLSFSFVTVSELFCWIFFWNPRHFISNFITNQIICRFCCFSNYSFWKGFMCTCCRLYIRVKKLYVPLKFLFIFLTILCPITARKTIFPRSRNIMESSKRPIIYHLFINFLSEKKTVFPITVMFKTRTSHLSVNITFLSTSWLKKDGIFYHRKVQNKNFSLLSK